MRTSRIIKKLISGTACGLFAVLIATHGPIADRFATADTHHTVVRADVDWP